MIVYESSAEPALRGAELDLAGRRVAARAFPYDGEVGEAPWRFDPIERRFLAQAPSGCLKVGPADPEVWRAAFARVAAGAVLVGPCDVAESVRGSYRAAAQGAALAGRGVYLLDPAPEALPEARENVFVALFTRYPGSRGPGGPAEARRRGVTAGVLLPLVPGWTAEALAVESIAEEARAQGAQFVAPIVPAADGKARRSIVQAHTDCCGPAPEDFFDRVHHAPWDEEIELARQALKEACARRGLAAIPPRPIGRIEASVNAIAAGRLEEKADALSERDEHRASLLHAAARWIDELGRDLGPILREGNFRKIFPFGEELARETEETLRSVR